MVLPNNFLNTGFFKDPTDNCQTAYLNKLGGGLPGKQNPAQVGTQDKALVRNKLRNTYSTVCNFKNYGLNNDGKTTPFRIATNSGDANGTLNNNPVPTMPNHNQVGSIQGNLVLSRISYNGTNSNGDAYYSGNPKYVYDSSNYVKYKKEQSINSNYNDATAGGNYKSTVSNVLFRVRH